MRTKSHSLPSALADVQITEKLDQKGYKVTEIEVDDGSCMRSR